MSKKELRDWQVDQEAKYSKIKKRHLKDLSPEDIEKIVLSAA